MQISEPGIDRPDKRGPSEADMFSITKNVILSCLFGLIYGHVDSFLTSPDVDTQAGFFPDSGFLTAVPHLESRSHQNPNYYHHGSHYNHLGTTFLRDGAGNNVDTILHPRDALAKRLQRFMTAMSHRKLLPVSKNLPTTSHVEDPAFLHLFTGAKDNKG
ncbi:unnamed protein product [Lymnaea stagnalis]|uniref:Uncharacterized protein n=1 Tax=Lymnaea stagnalis TaxID=6523 RepID=A0AAV2HRK7_LYMST